jgi:Rrf2 family protein
MAVADLAAQGGDACESLSAIGARQNISVTFLEQLFGKLRRAGLVDSVRGAQGGYRLSKPASSISLDSIIHAVDAAPKAHGCTPETKIACTGKTDRCLTHDLWGALENHIESFLASVTVQDVVDGRLPVAALEAAE